MKQDEIIEITRQAGGFSPTPEFLEAFAKLVAGKVRKDTLEEMIFAHPTTAIKLAVEKEREACAKVADVYVGQDLEHNFSALIAHNIRARGEA